VRRRLVVVCVFSPQKLDERSVVSKIKKEKYHTRSCVVSRDVVKTVGKKKKMQKNTQPTKKEPFCSVSPPPPPSIYTCALVSEAPAEEKNHVSLFTQTPKFTREERHDETLIWSKEDRRSAFVGGHDE
tara:strand:+ start:236 stop:619 length:384 start_codon:yes stop_codon:yes gene_type:complete